jgi:hypothetical protein
MCKESRIERKNLKRSEIPNRGLAKKCRRSYSSRVIRNPSPYMVEIGSDNLSAN